MKEIFHETHISAEQEKAPNYLRISQENENCERTSNHQPQTPSGTQKTERIKQTFPKANRLLSRGHFQAIFRSNLRFVGQKVIIDYRIGKSRRPKLGITVSKRYGKSHERNRFKRVVREAFRHFYPHFPQDIEMNVFPIHRVNQKSEFCKARAQNLNQAQDGAEAGSVDTQIRCRRVQKLGCGRSKKRFSNQEVYKMKAQKISRDAILEEFSLLLT